MIRQVSVTLSLDTAIYANGDVLAATQRIDGFFSGPKANGIIRSVVVLDKDNQGTALDLIFLGSNVVLGAENAAISIADADAESVQGVLSVAAADFLAMINSKVAPKHSLAIPVKGASDTDAFFIAAVVRSGTPTYSASGIVLQIFVEE